MISLTTSNDRQSRHSGLNCATKVDGERVAFEGKPTLIAAEVRKGDEVLMLGEADGLRASIGWRRRQSGIMALMEVEQCARLRFG